MNQKMNSFDMGCPAGMGEILQIQIHTGGLPTNKPSWSAWVLELDETVHGALGVVPNILKPAYLKGRRKRWMQTPDGLLCKMEKAVANKHGCWLVSSKNESGASIKDKKTGAAQQLLTVLLFDGKRFNARLLG